jgi:NADP-dependent 3-hydroxy acid dehydrogenase YdfG
MEGQARFKGCVVLVTGATSGIGRCCARKPLEEGAKVVAAGRRQERLDQLAAEARAALVLLLLSDAASWITGATVPSDGGRQLLSAR